MLLFKNIIFITHNKSYVGCRYLRRTLKEIFLGGLDLHHTRLTLIVQNV